MNRWVLCIEYGTTSEWFIASLCVTILLSNPYCTFDEVISSDARFVPVLRICDILYSHFLWKPPLFLSPDICTMVVPKEYIHIKLPKLHQHNTLIQPTHVNNSHLLLVLCYHQPLFHLTKMPFSSLFDAVFSIVCASQNEWILLHKFHNICC